MAILPPDPLYLLRGDMGIVHSLLFRVTPYIEHLYAGCESGNVHVWNLKTNRESFKIATGNDPCLSLHSTDETLITQRKGGGIDVWTADESRWTKSKSVDTQHCSFCRCQTMTDDILLVPLQDSAVGLLSLRSLEVESKLTGSKETSKNLGEVMSLKVFGDYALVAYESGSLAVWDVRGNRVVSWLETDSCPMSVDFDCSTMKGALGNSTNELQVFELSKSQTLKLKSQLTVKNPGISVVRIRPDSKVFVSGGWDGRLRIFSWKTLRPLAVLDQHRSTIHDVAYSSGKVESYNSKCLLAAAGKDSHVSLWDLYN